MRQAPSRVRVLVVEDEPIVRGGLVRQLQADDRLELAGQADSAREAVALARSGHPDVALLNGVLAGASSLRVCQALRAASPNLAVVVCAADAGAETVRDFVLAGASAYVLKDSSPADLIAALLAAARGASWLDPRATSAVFETIRRQQPLPSSPTPDVLSRQEQRVLPLVAAGKSNREIADALGVSPETVKSYVRSIMRKLNFTRRAQIAAYYTTTQAARAPDDA
ncbi:MAG: response regulator transcription factor [Chloroflexi bacterium]|nr:response regulator transcription factor [Chloroflexota bacterium]